MKAILVTILGSTTFFGVHLLLNHWALTPTGTLSTTVLGTIHLFVFLLFFGVTLLSNVIRRKFPAQFGLILSLISMFKVFIAVIFLVLLVKKLDVNRVVLILHFMSAYLITLYFFLFQLIKQQKHRDLHKT